MIGLKSNLLEKLAPGYTEDGGYEEKENFFMNKDHPEHPGQAERKCARTRHRAGDWVCILCNNHNYSFREVCNRCKQQTKQQNMIESLTAYKAPKADSQHSYGSSFAYCPGGSYPPPFFGLNFEGFSEGKTHVVFTTAPIKENSPEHSPRSGEHKHGTIFGFEWLDEAVEEQCASEEEFFAEESLEEIHRKEKIKRLFVTEI